MSDKDGGPAFPVTLDAEKAVYSGMTLRDWFAGQALAGIYASSFPDERCPPCDKIAEWSYAMADAMLAAREK